MSASISLSLSSLAALGLFLTPVLSQASNNSSAATEGSPQCPNSIPGFFNHNDCRLLCRSAVWTDILVFYVANFAAHAATVVSKPGQSTLSGLLGILGALLLPGSGVRNGLDAIISRAVFAKTDLQMAARAGALCAVMEIPVSEVPSSDARAVIGVEGKEIGASDGGRNNKSSTGADDGYVDEIANAMDSGQKNRKYNDVEATEPTDPAKSFEPRDRPARLLSTRIHGFCSLPSGYVLVVVPPNAKFQNDCLLPDSPLPKSASLLRRFGSSFAKPFLPETEPRTNISCSYNMVKILVSIAQLALTVTTLYRTRGDQIDLYGYAAFGLTVTPYAWMSFINLIGNLMCPQYDRMFVVESDGLDSLRRRMRSAGSECESLYNVTATVGRLDAETDLSMRASDADETTPRSFLWEPLRLMYTATMKQLRRVPDKDKPPTFDTIPVFVVVLGKIMSSPDRQTQSMILGAIPIAIVAGLSEGFHPGQSALYQRVWTIMWLVLGGVAGVIIPPHSELVEGRPEIGSMTRYHKMWQLWYFILGFSFVYGTLAVGGFVVVGQMIQEFGVCVLIQPGGGVDANP